jgi:mevalonate kinase
MEKRNKVNSITLRQNFPVFYQDLFSRCQIVVSASDSFFWAGEYSRFFGGLTIQQKLPTSNLVGLEILNEKKFCFADKLLGFNPSENTFESIPFDTAKQERLFRFLKEYWPSLDTKNKAKGFRIHMLSESHCGGGLGTTGVYLASLSAALLLLAEKITIEDIDKWKNSKISDLIDIKQYPSFDKVFRLAWRLNAICRGGHSSGATSFAALVTSPYPIIYLSENIIEDLDSLVAPKNNYTANDCKSIESTAFWGSKIDELFDLNMPQPWPIDIGRIFSGTLINTENIFKILSRIKDEAEKSNDQIKKYLGGKITNIDVRFLFDLGAEKNSKIAYQNHLDIFNMISAKILFSIKDLFNFGPDEDNMRKFISSIQQAQNFNHFLGHSTPLLDRICQTSCAAVANENEFNLAGAKIEGIGKGGHVLFIGPAGTISDKIIEDVEELAENTAKDIFLDWASWIDGFGENGLNVEQCLSKCKYSAFISPECHRVKTFVNDFSETSMASSKAIENIIQETDLTLDEEAHKIYVKGQILSSKEISSTKATIEIIKKVLENSNHKITNKDISRSSYGQNRYDLQGKIFIPLNKCLIKLANKKLNYEIHGGIYDNFSIGLDINNLTVAIIENI